MGIFDWLFGKKTKDILNDNGLNIIYEDSSTYLFEKRKEYKSSEYYKKGGKLHGLWKKYTLSGFVWDETNYKDGQPEFTKQYSKTQNGRIINHEIKYGKDGRWILQRHFYKGGQLEMEINLNGQNNHHGLFRTWYENGQLKEEGNFKDNKTDGLWKEYTENGQLKKEINYKDGKLDESKTEKDNSIDSKLRIHFDELEDVGIVTHYKGSPFSGIGYGFDEEEKLEIENTFRDGLRNGITKTFHKDGTLYSKQNYKNDKEDGLIKIYEYSEDGECEICEVDEKEFFEYNLKRRIILGLELDKIKNTPKEDNSNKSEMKQPVKQVKVNWDKLVENTRKKDNEKKSNKYKTLKEKHNIDFEIIKFCSLNELKELEKDKEYMFVMSRNFRHYSGCYQLEKSESNKSNKTINEWNDEYNYGEIDGDFDKTNEVYCSSPEMGYTSNPDIGSSGFGYWEFSKITSKDFIKLLNIKINECVKDTEEDFISLRELMIWLNGGEEDYDGMCLFNLLKIKDITNIYESIDCKNHIISWSSTENYIDSGDQDYLIGYIDEEQPQKVKKNIERNQNYLEKHDDSILRINKKELNITIDFESGEMISSYNNTLFTGIYYELYENGQVKIECEYKNGKINGLTKEWYENGQLKRQLIQQEKEPYERNKKCWDEDGNEIECKEE